MKYGDGLVRTYIEDIKSNSYDIDDKNKMFNDNIGLVNFIIKKHFMNSVRLGGLIEYDDLFQMGCEGLWKAVEKFDPNKDFKFSTFACKYIWGSISRYIRENFTFFHISRPSKDLYNKYKKLRDKGLSFIEICEELEVEESKMEDIIMKARDLISIDDEYSNENRGNKNIKYIETISDGYSLEDDVIENLYLNDILSVIKELDERYYKIVIMRLEGKTQEEIANEVGVTQVQVSRILTKLKNRIFPRIIKYLNNEIDYEDILVFFNKNGVSGRVVKNSIRENYREQIDAVKEWVINNKGKTFKIRDILREKDLECRVGYEHRIKEIAEKELIKEGYNLKYVKKKRGFDWYIVADGEENKTDNKIEIESKEIRKNLENNKDNRIDYNILYRGEINEDSVMYVMNLLDGLAGLSKVQGKKCIIELKVVS